MAKKDMEKVYAQDREDGRRIMAETAKELEKVMPLTYLFDRLKYLCEATKPIAATLISKSGKEKKQKDAGSMTHDFIEVPDNSAIAKGVDMGFLIYGAYAPKQINADVNHSGSVIADVVAARMAQKDKGKDKGKGKKSALKGKQARSK